MKTEEPFIALFFKGLSIVVCFIALFTAATGGAAGIITAAYLLLGAAPAAWWMGEVVALLGRIAANGEARVSTRLLARPEPAASGGKIFKAKPEDDGGVPTIKL
jgi:hypothetical protein